MPAPIIPAPSTPTLTAWYGGMPSGRSLPGVDRLEVEEERLDHVLRVLVDDQLRQVARLDPRGGVEVDLRALDRGGQDRPLGGVDRALGLLAQQRRERRQERRELGVARRAAGHPVAVGVPRVLRRVGVGLDPRLRGRDQLLAGRDQLVDQALLLGRRRLEAGALEQDVHQRRLDAEHPHDAGDAAAAGQQAERRLGQADLDLGVVDDHAVVAGEGDLVAAAERGAVDRGHDRAGGRSRAGAGTP